MMKLTIPLKGDLSIISKDDGRWYQVEIDEAKRLGIDLNDYRVGTVIYGMTERGKNTEYDMKNVDAYELQLIKIN